MDLRFKNGLKSNLDAQSDLMIPDGGRAQQDCAPTLGHAAGFGRGGFDEALFDGVTGEARNAVQI